MTPLERINVIRKWILEYVEDMDNPANCLVVGISGGEHYLRYDRYENISCVYAHIAKARAS